MVLKTLAVRLGAGGIALCDVQPGLIATDMTAAVIASCRARAETWLAPIPRVSQPGDMGAIMAALATGWIPCIGGRVVPADGGLLVLRFEARL